jgi:hypothetical protein
LKGHEAIIELATMTFKFSSCNLYYVACVVTVVLHRHVTCYTICQESFFLNLNLYSTVRAMWHRGSHNRYLHVMKSNSVGLAGA